MKNPFRASLIDRITNMNIPVEERQRVIEAMADLTLLARLDPTMLTQVTGMTAEELRRQLEIEAALDGVSVEAYVSSLNAAFLHAMHPPRELERQSARLGLDTLATYCKMGAELWYASYRLTTKHSVAISLLQKWAQAEQESGRGMWLAMMSSAGSQFMIMAAALWADRGFPVVELSPTEVREFGATSVTEEMTVNLAPPWPAFLIRFGPDLLFTDGETGRFSVRAIIIGYIEEFDESYPVKARDADGFVRRWGYSAFSMGGPDLTRLGFRAADFADGSDRQTDGFTLPLSDEDRRSQVAVRRIIFQVCARARLRGQNVLVPFGKAHQKTPEELRRAAPMYRNFRLR